MKRITFQKIFLIILFHFLYLSNVSCQKNKDEDSHIQWLNKNAINVKTIDPAVEDFSDLQPLKKIIGDSARILMLGEQNHGDGSTILAKIRLIKFLHTEMGYDILSFESCMYDAWKAQQQIFARKEIPPVLKKGINQIWSNTVQFEPLLDFISLDAYSDNPLLISGFDCQYTGDYSYKELFTDLQILINSIKDSSISDKEVSIFNQVINSSMNYLYKPSTDLKTQFEEVVSKLIHNTENHFNDTANSKIDYVFWSQELRNIRGQINYMFNNTLDNTFTTDAPNAYLRDKQMAENLLWLSNNYYKGKKIIVWAANYHCIRNPQLLEYVGNDYRFKSNTRMGEFIYNEIGNKAFLLSFTSDKGKTSYNNGNPPVDIAKPSNGSFEDLFSKTGFEYSIIGFRNLEKNGEWVKDKTIMRGSIYLEFKANWPEVVDGVFFIKDMKPSNVLKY